MSVQSSFKKSRFSWHNVAVVGGIGLSNYLSLILLGGDGPSSNNV